MVTGFGLRPFQRSRLNRILIHLTFDEWPSDVPLLAGAKIHEMGHGPVMPYWLLELEPNQTVEFVFGWFDFPCPLAEALTWYQNQMETLGWKRDSKHEFTTDQHAALNFVQPQLNYRVEVSIRRMGEISTAYVSRTLKHPFTPATDEAPLQVEAQAVEPMLVAA